MAKVFGKNAQVVRDVAANDPGFDANKAKVIVRYDDGREETVAKTDVKE